MNRRAFLLSALAAPAVVTAAGLLMPVRKPPWTATRLSYEPREWTVDAPGGYLTVYDSLGKAYRIPVCL